MMSSRTMVLFLVVSMVSVSVLGTAFAAPLGTAFTYQGKLTTSTGEPVNGTADFRFTLWDAAIGGSQIGSLVSVDTVNVTGGLFTVSLDFGSSPFTGLARWLEIAVRTPAGSGSYTLFGTRQPITPEPYALYSTSSAAADTLDGNHGSYYQNASNINAGTLADARLSTNVALLNTVQTFSANKYFSGNVGIGVTSAPYPLMVENPSSASHARAIYGLASSTTNAAQDTWAIVGETRSTGTVNAGGGVLGYANSSTGTAPGVFGYSMSTQGIGISARTFSSTGVTRAVSAYCDSPDGWAGHFTGRGYFSGNVGIGNDSPFAKLDVTTTNATQPSIKVVHTATTNDQPAIYGEHAVSDFYGVGVYGKGGWKGVFGECNPTGSSSYYAVNGFCSGGTGSNYGGIFQSQSGTNNYGAYGSASGGTTAYGVYGTAYGATTSYAGYFSGNVHVTGTLSAGTKTFKIDHPLDPANKYLNHYCVEGPEILNVYSGNIVTDESGYATVKLPDYFEAINKDFRYQLTVVDNSDDFVLAKVVGKVKNNQFVIRTNKPSVEVSWEVKGVRNDKWANVYAVAVEQDKSGSEKGKYLYPDLYGKSLEQGIGYMPNPGTGRDMISKK